MYLTATPNDVECSRLIETRLKIVLNRLHREHDISFEHLPITIQQAAKLWRRMHHRLIRGILKVTESERSATVDLGSWLIEKSAQLNGHPVPKAEGWNSRGIDLDNLV